MSHFHWLHEILSMIVEKKCKVGWCLTVKSALRIQGGEGCISCPQHPPNYPNLDFQGVATCVETRRRGTPLFVVAGAAAAAPPRYPVCHKLCWFNLVQLGASEPLPGVCPNSLCGMQAVMYCKARAAFRDLPCLCLCVPHWLQFDKDVDFWWIKPKADLGCTSPQKLSQKPEVVKPDKF